MRGTEKLLERVAKLARCKVCDETVGEPEDFVREWQDLGEVIDSAHGDDLCIWQLVTHSG